MRLVLTSVVAVVLAAFALAGCSHAPDLTGAGYPRLSEVPDRPLMRLTPERTEVVTNELIASREAAQAFAALGFRETGQPGALRAAPPSNEPVPAVVRPAPIQPSPAIERPVQDGPLSTSPALPADPATATPVSEEPIYAPVATAAPEPEEPTRISPEALAASRTPEELLSTEEDFK